MLGEALGVNMPPKENSDKTGGDGKDPGKKKEDPLKEGEEKVKETGTRRKTTRKKGEKGTMIRIQIPPPWGRRDFSTTRTRKRKRKGKMGARSEAPCAQLAQQQRES